MSRLVLVALLLCASCAPRVIDPVDPTALEVGSPETVFVATSRAQEDDGTFGAGRSQDLSLLEVTVSVPPDRIPGQFRKPRPPVDPRREFVTAEREILPSEAVFRKRLKAQLDRLPPDRRAVTVFVHGYNDTQPASAFRVAQMQRDLKIPGVIIAYSWPSRGSPLGYIYDQDSMAFGRDGLERLLRIIRSETGRPVLLIAHSLGSYLSMEALRQADIKTPGWSSRALAGVILISPDLDIEVFRTQMARLQPPPSPLVIFSNTGDRALDVSGWMRGDRAKGRLGNVDGIEQLTDLPVLLVDMSEFNDPRGLSHFLPASSPALLAVLSETGWVDRVFGENNVTLSGRFGQATVAQSGQAAAVKLPAVPQSPGAGLR
ncbi:alpha/beta hydrolase [Chachezhania sediminis]|uniref:alpha/beta hydrolase n=1 Tax=Chachezhania sediminis TaxID=2599291 RepID=UPI001E3E1CA3|nr:alpha/beta fold hydrolase [Chachezhania sediminis]